MSTFYANIIIKGEKERRERVREREREKERDGERERGERERGGREREGGERGGGEREKNDSNVTFPYQETFSMIFAAFVFIIRGCAHF